MQSFLLGRASSVAHRKPLTAKIAKKGREGRKEHPSFFAEKQTTNNERDTPRVSCEPYVPFAVKAVSLRTKQNSGRGPLSQFGTEPGTHDSLST
jgi:hypothetical protein